MRIEIQDEIAETAKKYANEAGIDLESLTSLALSYFVKSDRLSVDENRLRELEVAARTVELKKRAGNTVPVKTSKTIIHEPPQDVYQASTKGDVVEQPESLPFELTEDVSISAVGMLNSNGG